MNEQEVEYFLDCIDEAKNHDAVHDVMRQYMLIMSTEEVSADSAILRSLYDLSLLPAGTWPYPLDRSLLPKGNLI